MWAVTLITNITDFSVGSHADTTDLIVDGQADN